MKRVNSYKQEVTRQIEYVSLSIHTSDLDTIKNMHDKQLIFTECADFKKLVNRCNEGEIMENLIQQSIFKNKSYLSPVDLEAVGLQYV